MKVWLRVDCDDPLFYHERDPFNLPRRFLNYFSLLSNIRIPLLHNQSIWEMKKFLADYEINRIWFFRPCTCPERWDEPFGLHATYNDPKRFRKELDFVQRKLGKVEVFTHHGFAQVKSGTYWSKRDVKEIEDTFGLTDLSFVPHYAPSRHQNMDLGNIKAIFLHPRDINGLRNELKQVLDEVTKWNHQ